MNAISTRFAPMIPIPGYTLTAPVCEVGDLLLYRATRTFDGLPVLLKVPAVPRPSPSVLRRLEHEYALTKNLDSSRIARPLAIEHFDGSVALILEQGPTETLASRLDSPMDIRTFLQIAIGTTAALSELHRHELVHKDLKPEHVLLDAGKVWLTGLGIASRLPRERQAPEAPGAMVGTLAYMAPEQTGRMNRSIDSRSDLYALGVTFYRMLTGVLPFITVDPMELVHCHIARQPVPPSQRVADLPEILSEMVMKLLAKNAEDRYQSAAGLNAELLRCREQWESTGRIEPFPLGAQDVSERLMIPEKLYGRRAEVDTLLTAFDRVVACGSPELVLVSGYSGVGKTSLVQEVHRPIVEARGFFLEGKFDQLQRNVPYFAWIQAFGGFVNYLLMEGEERLEKWKELILSAVGGIGRVFTEVIPNLERIIGVQPEVPTLGPKEAQNRFNYVFLELIGAIAASEHPLVVFLDDLQWIDAASLNLLQTLMSCTGVSNLLVIGAYRDNEVDALHPLTMTIETLRKEQARIDLLTLGDLSEKTVNELIADTLRHEHSETILLTQLICSRTGGNPFFLLQTLRTLAEKQAISFDNLNRCWKWDIAALKTMEITGNVVALMLEKIQKLPLETRRILPLAACMGYRFDLFVLGIIAEQSGDAALKSLQPALRDGLITPLSGGFQFAHDRIQQAAYFHIPDADRKKVHLQIGRLLLEHLSESEHEEQLFAVVDHLNIGSELIEARDEKFKLARLNLRAGSKARASAAFSAAAKYLEAGAALLDGENWETDYDLTLELHTRAAEAASLVLNHERTDQLFDVVSSRAHDPVDIVGIYQSRINTLMSQGMLNDAVDCGLELVDRLGVHINPHPTVEDVYQKLKDVMATYDPKNIHALIDLPPMTDPFVRAAMNTINTILGPAYSGRPYLHAYLCFEQVRLYNQHGSTPDMMVTFSSYTLRLVGLPFGDIDQGYEFGMLSIALAERENSPGLMPKVIPPIIGCLWPYKRHMRDVLDVLPSLYSPTKEVGDFEFAGYIVCFYAPNAYFAGRNLDALEKEVAVYDQDLRLIQSVIGRRWVLAFLQAMQNLLGRAKCPWILDGEAYNRQEMLRILVETGNLAAQSALHVNTLILCYLFECYNEALEATTLTVPCQAGLIGMPIEPMWHFYDSLTRLALYPKLTNCEKQAFLERVATNQAYLEMRAHHAPMNYLNKWQLVEAERASALGNKMAAIEHYRRAITLARENGFIQEEALANELAARFWLGEGDKDYARLHLSRAHSGYVQWQAWAKVKALENEYPHLLNAPPLAPTGTISALPQDLDILAAVRASQAISGEIILDNLLKALMRIVLENAGAREGSLLLNRGEELSLAAEARVEKQNLVMQIHTDPGFPEALFPASILNYVRRSQDKVLLDNASDPNVYSTDEYFSRRHPKSVLCFPIVKQTKLIGVLYLENDLATHSFTPDRLVIIELLAAQAAIALENALVYEALQESEERLRRREQEFRAVVENSPDAISRYDRDCRRVYINPTMERMFGRPAEDVLGKKPTDLSPLAEAVLFEQQVREVLESGLPLHAESHIRTAEGEIRWGHIRFVPEFGQDGEVASVLSIGRDITERKVLEEALAAREQEFRTLAENSPNIIIRYDGECRRTYVNPAFIHETGKPYELLVGAYPESNWLPTMPVEEYTATLRQVMETGVPARIVVEWPWQDDSRITCHAFHLVAEHGTDGQVTGCLAIGHNITALKEAEAALLAKQEHLATMAVELSLAEERERRRIAAELHDHIGQTLLLSRIKLGTLADRCESASDEETYDEIQSLLEQTIRDVRSLTQQLNPPVLASVGFEAALEWLTKRIEADYALRVDFVDDLNDKPLSEELRAVVFQSARELLINVAKHAATSEASLTISREADRLLLTVEDQGKGFAHSPEQGTNLPQDCSFGLFNIRQRIKLLGGDVVIESVPGQGTSATIRVPLAVGDLTLK